MVNRQECRKEVDYGSKEVGQRDVGGHPGSSGAPPGPSGPPPPAGILLWPAELQKLVADAVAAAQAAAAAAPPPPSPEQPYRNTLGNSQGKWESWSVKRCAQVGASLLVEAAKLREVLTAHPGEHAWKRPGRALEATEFPELCWAKPELESEKCDIDELPGSAAASGDDWCVCLYTSCAAGWRRCGPSCGGKGRQGLLVTCHSCLLTLL
ncbi:hypothetical protein CYMTET_46030 [Cymbomonas tetramitiformis]|uniref:Uncharacterized protein n=1 Tax=Cymbomonas tetramitiformis TaxID=36881 RepID=A0AAE0ESL1_9CHLO|nr:hypothetical protein CYMTET_52579 [Cymbomonas tetramitiformis]KAK3244353.1 hypothetical protein CYMTET_46030 [Cymbomonas tetramitiformis]